LLGLHLPHYLAETASPASYAAYPGPILVATMIGSALAAIAIGRNRRFGWLLGIGVAVLSWVLYIVQETVGLPGLSQTWWEPTRLLSLLPECSWCWRAVNSVRAGDDARTANASVTRRGASR
jgi:hypothetical protein